VALALAHAKRDLLRNPETRSPFLTGRLRAGRQARQAAGINEGRRPTRESDRATPPRDPLQPGRCPRLPLQSPEGGLRETSVWGRSWAVWEFHRHRFSFVTKKRMLAATARRGQAIREDLIGDERAGLRHGSSWKHPLSRRRVHPSELARGYAGHHAAIGQQVPGFPFAKGGRVLACASGWRGRMSTSAAKFTAVGGPVREPLAHVLAGQLVFVVDPNASDAVHSLRSWTVGRCTWADSS
jgi:hypothetical protein